MKGKYIYELIKETQPKLLGNVLIEYFDYLEAENERLRNGSND